MHMNVSCLFMVLLMNVGVAANILILLVHVCLAHFCKTFSMCIPRWGLLGSTHVWSFARYCQMTLQFLHPSVVGERFCLPHTILNTF